MKKNLIKATIILSMLLLTLIPLSVNASTEYTYEDLKYTISNDEITIIRCDYSVTNVKIPAIINGYPVTKIGKSAFSACFDLTDVIIPDSVTIIEKYAFILCKNLTNVRISNNITVIDEEVFSSCYSLSSVEIPHGIQKIGFGAFSSCDSLTTLSLPASITEICDEAFYECSNLEDIYYNGTQSEWEEVLIGYANNPLTDAKLHYPIQSGECGTNLTWTLSDNGTFILIGYGEMKFDSWDSNPWRNYKSNIKKVIISDGITNIGNGAFGNCTNLESVILPSSLIKIGNYAFEYCENLNSLNIPNGVISIGDSAFRWCTSLSEITFPSSLEVIDIYAFYECDKINNVTLPESATTIDHHAFFGCDSLTNIYIPDTVKGISYKVFNNSGYYNNSENWINGILYINNHLIVTDDNVTECIIKDGTITIANGSLCSCSGGKNIKTIYIPKSVEYISEGCFDYYLPAVTDIYYDGYKKEWEELISATYNLDKFETINIHCLPPSISTELTNNIFLATPTGVENGNRIIFACYNGNKMVYVNPYIYAGETTIPFSTTETYDKVKVFVWENLETCVPLCEAENVPLN